MQTDRTEIVGVIRKIGTHAVTLIDTAGFDDTTRSNSDGSGAIAVWMQASYGEGALVSGIIHLHSITNSRMTGSSTDITFLFRKRCGVNNTNKVLFVTSRWDLVPQDQSVSRPGGKPLYWTNGMEQYYRERRSHRSV